MGIFCIFLYALKSISLTVIDIGLSSQISLLIEDLVQNLNNNLNLNQIF